MSTTYLRDGNVLFLVGVSPRDESEDYEAAFRRIRQKPPDQRLDSCRTGAKLVP